MVQKALLEFVPVKIRLGVSEAEIAGQAPVDSELVQLPHFGIDLL